MDTAQKLDELRHEIRKLQQERDLAIFQKGLCARDNNDLRENAQYDYYLERELYLTGKIANVAREIEKINIAKTALKIRGKTSLNAKTKPKEADDLPKNTDLLKKHKWL